MKFTINSYRLGIITTKGGIKNIRKWIIMWIDKKVKIN